MKLLCVSTFSFFELQEVRWRNEEVSGLRGGACNSCSGGAAAADHCCSAYHVFLSALSAATGANLSQQSSDEVIVFTATDPAQQQQLAAGFGLRHKGCFQQEHTAYFSRAPSNIRLSK